MQQKLIPGDIPKVSEGSVSRTVCVPGVRTDCDKTYTIKVYNCGDYRVYYLKRPTACPEGYCFGMIIFLSIFVTSLLFFISHNIYVPKVVCLTINIDISIFTSQDLVLGVSKSLFISNIINSVILFIYY